MRSSHLKKNQRGAALVEFAIAATIFLTAVFAVLEFGRALWIHNALVDATRRGARYAVTQGQGASAAIQNVTVYGNPDGTGTPLIDGLTTTKVNVRHSDYQLGSGSVTVKIEAYDFNFVLPFLGTAIRMPECQTSLPSESAGLIPASI